MPADFYPTTRVTIYKEVWGMTYDPKIGWADRPIWVAWRYYDDIAVLKDEFQHGCYAAYVFNKIHKIQINYGDEIIIYLEMPNKHNRKNRLADVIKACINM